MRGLKALTNSLVLVSFAFVAHCGSNLASNSASDSDNGVAGGNGGDGLNNSGASSQSSGSDDGVAPTHGDADAGAAASATGTGLPCDVQSVLATNCQSCHGATPSAGAPTSLLTWADLNAPAKSDPTKKEYELVLSLTHSTSNPMPPPPNLILNATDQSTIDSWVSAGAPQSSATCAPTQPANNGAEPLTCTPDLHFAPPTPWAMPQDQEDQYVCYGVDVPSTANEGIVAFAPHIDNKKIVHHMLLFRASSTVSPTPTACSAGGSLEWSLMYGWAPGGKNMYMPAEASYPIDPTQPSHFVVQIHYNNAAGLAGQTDSTGMDMCTGAPRKYDADVIAFGTQSISIPPNGTLDKTCSLTLPASMAGLNFVAAMPHMHTLGTAIDTHLTPKAGGAPQDMGTVANWNFQNQSFLPITVTSAVGDTITTHCAWKNTTGSTVKFGENTEDEMCYSFTMYYPKITAAFWTWASPAIEATCN